MVDDSIHETVGDNGAGILKAGECERTKLDANLMEERVILGLLGSLRTARIEKIPQGTHRAEFLKVIKITHNLRNCL